MSKADRKPPPGWNGFRAAVHKRWLLPLLLIDWLAEWAAYGLSRLSILELLEYCGSFSILIAVIFYFVDAPDRTKSRHYQAWQVINTAQGKGGSGGRIEALHELNDDGVALVGVDVSGAFLQGVGLDAADLRRGNFQATDLRAADLAGASLVDASLISANLRRANLDRSDLTEADLSNADLNQATLRQANLRDAILIQADLRGADLAELKDWKSATVKLANIHDVRNAPIGFVEWAISKGAIDEPSDDEWNRRISQPAKPTSRP